MRVGSYLLRLAHPEQTTRLSLQAIALTSYATLNSRSTTCWASESCRLPCTTDLSSCFSPSAETTGQDVSIEPIEINLKNSKNLAGLSPIKSGFFRIASLCLRYAEEKVARCTQSCFRTKKCQSAALVRRSLTLQKVLTQVVQLHYSYMFFSPLQILYYFLNFLHISLFKTKFCC